MASVHWPISRWKAFWNRIRNHENKKWPPHSVRKRSGTINQQSEKKRWQTLPYALQHPSLVNTRQKWRKSNWTNFIQIQFIYLISVCEKLYRSSTEALQKLYRRFKDAQHCISIISYDVTNKIFQTLIHVCFYLCKERNVLATIFCSKKCIRFRIRQTPFSPFDPPVKLPNANFRSHTCIYTIQLITYTFYVEWV